MTEEPPSFNLIPFLVPFQVRLEEAELHHWMEEKVGGDFCLPSSEYFIFYSSLSCFALKSRELVLRYLTLSLLWHLFSVEICRQWFDEVRAKKASVCGPSSATPTCRVRVSMQNLGSGSTYTYKTNLLLCGASWDKQTPDIMITRHVNSSDKCAINGNIKDTWGKFAASV